MIDVLSRLSRWLAWAAGAALIGAAAIVTVEVILRKAFFVSLNVASEVSSYVLGICAAWGFAFALFNRAHVRVDAAVRYLPLRLAAWSDLLAIAALTLYAALLAWCGYGSFIESWAIDAHANTPLGTPLWIPQGLWAMGLMFFLLVCLVLLGRGLTLLVQGRAAESRALIGAGTIEEESLSEVKEFIDREGLSR